MKHLKNLRNKLIKPLNEPGEAPTLADVLSDCLFYATPSEGTTSIKLIRMASKILDAGEEIQLEDAEFQMVKDGCNSNPRKYFAWVHGQVMERLIECEVQSKGA